MPRLAPPSPATLIAVRNLALHQCDATTASVLDALDAPAASVVSIYYDRRASGGSDRAYLQGYDAWVRVAGQSGDLVIRHDADCRFIGSYTIGGLRLGTRRPS